MRYPRAWHCIPTFDVNQIRWALLNLPKRETRRYRVLIDRFACFHIRQCWGGPNQSHKIKVQYQNARLLPLSRSLADIQGHGHAQQQQILHTYSTPPVIVKGSGRANPSSRRNLQIR